jgi:hypothetical protein
LVTAAPHRVHRCRRQTELLTVQSTFHEGLSYQVQLRWGSSKETYL